MDDRIITQTHFWNWDDLSSTFYKMISYSQKYLFCAFSFPRFYNVRYKLAFHCILDKLFLGNDTISISINSVNDLFHTVTKLFRNCCFIYYLFTYLDKSEGWKILEWKCLFYPMNEWISPPLYQKPATGVFRVVIHIMAY